MELVLSQNEIDNLLREALQAREVKLPENYVMRVRRNNKTSTIRVVYVDPMERSRRSDLLAELRDRREEPA